MQSLRTFKPSTSQNPSPCQWLTIGLLFVIILVAGQHNVAYSVHYDEIMHVSSRELAETVEAGSIARRIALLVLLVGAAFMLIRTRGRDTDQTIIRSNMSLSCFVVLAFLSVLWSDEPSLTFRRSTEYLILCIGAAATGRILGARGVVWLGFLGSTGYLVIGLVSEVVLGTFRPFSLDYRFCGTLHPNHQAWNCCLLLISGSVLLPQLCRFWRPACLLAMFLGAACLLLTKSRTSLVCGMLALAFYWARRMSGMQKLRLVYFSGTILVAVLFAATLLDARLTSRLDQTLLAGRDQDTYQNFSGRIPLWSLCMEYVGVRPLTGYGFESFWTMDHISDISAQEGWTVPISHNGFIELMLGVGVTGLTLYLYQLASTWRLLQRSYGATYDPYVRFYLALSLFYFACMFAEAIAFDIGLPTFCLLSMLWSREQFAAVPSESITQTARTIHAY